jgi:hypothetical protein
MVPLGLIPQGRQQYAVAVLGTAVSYFWIRHIGYVGPETPLAAYAQLRDALIVGCTYPMLAMVLRRPNVGAVPSWVDRSIARATRVVGRWAPAS